MAESESQVLPSSVYTSPDDIPVRDVARLMTARGIGAIVVVDQQKKPIGILTDRDIVSRVTAPGQNAADVLVGAVMSRPLVTITDQETLDVGIAEMNRHGIRRLPIVDLAGDLVSILTLDDIIRYRLSEGADLSGIVRDRSIRLEPDPDARARPEPDAIQPEAAPQSQPPPPPPPAKPSRLESGLEFKPGVTPDDLAKSGSSRAAARPSVVVPMVKRNRGRTFLDGVRQWVSNDKR
jgi:CBS domain-containing protein